MKEAEEEEKEERGGKRRGRRRKKRTKQGREVGDKWKYSRRGGVAAAEKKKGTGRKQ